MSWSRAVLLLPLVGVVLAAGFGCGDATGVESGSLRILVQTSGAPGPAGYVLSLNGESSRSVAPTAAVRFGGLAPGNHTVLLDGIPASCLTNGPNPRNARVVAGIDRELVFFVVCGAMGRVTLTAVTTGTDPDANGYRVEVASAVGAPAWSADLPANGTVSVPGVTTGEHLVRVRHVAANCRSGEPRERPVTITTGGTVVVNVSVACVPAGQLAYVAADAAGRTDLFLVSANGASERTLVAHSAEDRDPAWSPDGGRIAFSSDRDGIMEVYVLTVDGSTRPVRITHDGGRQPAWSPDGQRIAFTSERDGNQEIYLTNQDGTDPVRLTTSAAADFDPVWSPDGTQIAFASERDGNAEIYLMNSDGTRPRRVTDDPAPDDSPDWSPDGLRLAFARTWCDGAVTCTPTVFVLNVASPGDPQAIASGSQPAWSPDGGVIAYSGFRCDAYWYWYYGLQCSFTGVEVVREDGTDAIGLKEWSTQPAWRPGS